MVGGGRLPDAAGNVTGPLDFDAGAVTESLPAITESLPAMQKPLSAVDEDAGAVTWFSSSCDAKS